MFQIYQAAPHILTPVMPSVLDELRDQDDAKRLKALDLLGKLFSMKGPEACTAFPELFLEFLRRSTDQKASPFPASPVLARVHHSPRVGLQCQGVQCLPCDLLGKNTIALDDSDRGQPCRQLCGRRCLHGAPAYY